jgi:hypothetical protein
MNFVNFRKIGWNCFQQLLLEQELFKLSLLVLLVMQFRGLLIIREIVVLISLLLSILTAFFFYLVLAIMPTLQIKDMSECLTRDYDFLHVNVYFVSDVRVCVSVSYPSP